MVDGNFVDGEWGTIKIQKGEPIRLRAVRRNENEGPHIMTTRYGRKCTFTNFTKFIPGKSNCFPRQVLT